MPRAPRLRPVVRYSSSRSLHNLNKKTFQTGAALLQERLRFALSDTTWIKEHGDRDRRKPSPWALVDSATTPPQTAGCGKTTRSHQKSSLRWPGRDALDHSVPPSQAQVE